MEKLRVTADDVRSAYRLLLGREPDSAGFEHHLQHAFSSSLGPVDLANVLMRSEEFKARQHERPRLAEVVLHGVKIFPWSGDKLIGDGLLSSNVYEPHVLPRFLAQLDSGDVVLDVGANIGIYSLTAAAKVGERGKVIAVEPVARNVQSLCMGIHANRFTNVSVLPVAASSASSIVGVFRHESSSNGIVDSSITGAIASEFVPTQRLDELLGYLTRLDVIKIDIEGHEPIAWPGLKTLVERHRPIIFSEFSPAAITNHSRLEPESYLAELFSVAAGSVQVLREGMHPVACSTPDEVMREWRGANPHMLSTAEGTIHLDLVVNTRVQPNV